MKTIALRFAENFAPKAGTIAEHERLISSNGYVWYGKLGSAVSTSVINEILLNDSPRILLIHSGKAIRFWAFVESIQNETPDKQFIPEYYRERTQDFKTWFKVIRFEVAPSDVLSKCIVSSSKRPLSEVSRSSMNPYFIIETEGLTK